MNTQEFISKLNYPSRKVDGNFILNNKVEDVEDYLNTFQEGLNKYNKTRQEVITRNQETHNNLLTYFLETLNVKETTIFKMKKRGRGWTATTVRGDMYSHWKKVFEDVKEYVPLRKQGLDIGKCSCTYELLYNKTSLTLRFHNAHTIGDIFEQSVLVIKQYEDSIAQTNEHLMFAKGYLQDKVVSYGHCITSQDIINLAEELSKEEYREGLEGDEIDVTHGDGDDCTWQIGDYRCTCGNNRYYLEVDGNMKDGYYSYGQWC